ncbi:thioredoxin domain-containing protein [Enterococcus olivae]
MDISVIKAENTNKKVGIPIGEKAPKEILEFMNLRCPYCKKWFEESKDILLQAVAENKVQRLIKLVDKDKESLQRGNVMHRFVVTDDPEQALTEMTKIFETQDQWGNLSLEEVATFAKEKLHLSEHDHLDYASKLVEEAEQANIRFVPTVIIDNHIFDESIDEDLLKNYLA